MTTTMTDVIGALNHLISICLDGEKGYSLAAEHETELQSKELYRQYSAQRMEMVSELKETVRRLGGDPEKGGTISGNIHRGWLGMKASVSHDSEFSIAVECERGEDAAVHAYEDALKHDIPKHVSDLLVRQYSQVKEAHDRVKMLRDSQK